MVIDFQNGIPIGQQLMIYLPFEKRPVKVNQDFDSYPHQPFRVSYLREQAVAGFIFRLKLMSFVFVRLASFKTRIK